MAEIIRQKVLNISRNVTMLVRVSQAMFYIVSINIICVITGGKTTPNDTLEKLLRINLHVMCV